MPPVITCSTRCVTRFHGSLRWPLSLNCRAIMLCWMVSLCVLRQADNNFIIIRTMLGFEPTGPNVGADDAIDSDGVLTTPRNASQALIDSPDYGVDDLTIDFGFVAQFNVGDFVWLDENGNGIQDASELGIASVVVQVIYISRVRVSLSRLSHVYSCSTMLEHCLLRCRQMPTAFTHSTR
jgi:hypothetical protein